MRKSVALNFVRHTGDEVEQARLQYILTGKYPSELVINKLFANQRPDGGWSPFWAENYSSLDATCYRLAQAEQLGIAASEPAVVRAHNFLSRRQSAEGSWQEDESIANQAPPWARPGDLAAQLYLTANCGLWLALREGQPSRAVRAAEYLHKHLQQDGSLPGFLHTHWLAAGLWYKLNMPGAANRTIDYLEMQLNQLPASNLAWLTTTLCAAGVPATHPLLHAAASLLEQSQQQDGRWQSEDGPARDVHTTLEALRALSLCGRFMV